MRGFGILLGKELLQAWRTFQLPVVVGLFVFTGISSPLLARFLPEIIELAAGDQLGAFPIPTPTAADSVAQLQKNLIQFGGLAAILLAMGAVATEKDRGTAAFVLAKPVGRRAFLAAKVVVLGGILLLSTVVATAVAWIYTAVLFEPLPVGGWVALAVLTWLSLATYAAVTFLASTVTGSSMAAAGIGFVALILLGVVSAIPNLDRFGPVGLGGPAAALATGSVGLDSLGSDLAIGVVSTLVFGAIVLGAAQAAFARQEL